ncbi:6-phosphogluconolactonase [Membranihabitans marinus]|uniref:6-phosphogluconolactonase n=1 Tax=Membranihabitans marinus TaxID=1227546 RepID=UPI001F0316E1|nr:6-phosphogluconolactonase [Membranihabitans marinus]
MAANIHILTSNTQWELSIVEELVRLINTSINQQGRCSISLAGGSTPKSVYALLALPTFSDKIDWSKVYLFWGDERSVPHSHSDSNYKMVKESLIDHIDIPAENVLALIEPDQPQSSALAYEETIKGYFKSQDIAIDIMLLGMGDDGHTASLFPGTEILEEKKRLVKEVYLPNLDVYRISLTAPMINASKNILFLVKGENKAPALREVLSGTDNYQTYPSQLIKKDESVHFYLDEAAAKFL